MTHVRKGGIYVFHASLWDIADRRPYMPDEGTRVRVIHPHGCPAPNTMGHCHIESLAGQFLGLVACASLHRKGIVHD